MFYVLFADYTHNIYKYATVNISERNEFLSMSIIRKIGTFGSDQN